MDCGDVLKISDEVLSKQQENWFLISLLIGIKRISIVLWLKKK